MATPPNAICQARDLHGHVGIFRVCGGRVLYNEVQREGRKVRLIRHRGRSTLVSLTTPVEVIEILK